MENQFRINFRESNQNLELHEGEIFLLPTLEDFLQGKVQLLKWLDMSNMALSLCVLELTKLHPERETEIREARKKIQLLISSEV